MTSTKECYQRDKNQGFYFNNSLDYKLNLYNAMLFLEIKAKQKSGKENELNQVLTDLIPVFQDNYDFRIDVALTEVEAELNIKFSNGNVPEKINELMEDKNFILLLGSLKVLCENYSIVFPKVNNNKNNFIVINSAEDVE